MPGLESPLDHASIGILNFTKWKVYVDYLQASHKDAANSSNETECSHVSLHCRRCLFSSFFCSSIWARRAGCACASLISFCRFGHTWAIVPRNVASVFL